MRRMFSEKQIKEMIKQATQSGAKVWKFEYGFIEEVSFDDIPEGMKVGDIIVDQSYIFVGIVANINYEEYTLELYGINDSIEPTIASLNVDTWLVQAFPTGTQLYKHEIIGSTSGNQEVGLILITDTSTAITSQVQLVGTIQYGNVFILIDGYIDEVMSQAFKICDWSGDLTMMGIDSNTDQISGHIFTISGSLTDTVTPL